MDRIKAGKLIGEGTHDTGRFERLARPYGMLRPTGTLAEMAARYTFCNYGAIFTHGGLDKDPLVNFTARNPEIALAMIILPKPAFAGIAVGRTATYMKHWEHALIGVPFEYWEEADNELRLSAWVDRDRQTFARALRQELRVVDQLALARLVAPPATMPTITVYAYGVDATWTQVAFAEDVTHPHSVAKIIRLPVRAETVTLGAAYLAGDQAPFRSIESEDPLEGLSSIVPPAID